MKNNLKPMSPRLLGRIIWHLSKFVSPFFLCINKTEDVEGCKHKSTDTIIKNKV